MFSITNNALKDIEIIADFTGSENIQVSTIDSRQNTNVANI